MRPESVSGDRTDVDSGYEGPLLTIKDHPTRPDKWHSVYGERPVTIIAQPPKDDHQDPDESVIAESKLPELPKPSLAERLTGVFRILRRANQSAQIAPAED